MPTPTLVTDRSNTPDNIAGAAQTIGKSKHRRAVFEWVYKGKKSYRTVSELIKLTKLPHQRVLDAGKRLADGGYIHQTKAEGETAYRKDAALKHHKRKILSLAGDPKKLKAFPTRRNPQVIVKTAKVVFPKEFYVRAELVTVDDISSFKKVKAVRPSSVRDIAMKEMKFKNGVKKIIGEKGRFVDWPGEKNDIFCTRVEMKSKRVATAIAFKGPGKKGKLTPGKMGKHGDQIQRLFSSTAADLYLLQYWSQIDESVVEQMKMLAVAKSALERKQIRFGVIDGTDSARLIKAYPKQFR